MGLIQMAVDSSDAKPNATRALNELLRTMSRDINQAEYAQAAQCEFEKLYYEHEGRGAHKWHHYLEVYDRHLGAFLKKRQAQGSKPIRLLEIGIGSGGSLQIWRKYLGPDAIVFGIDIDAERVANAQKSGSQARVGSQASPNFLRSVVEEMGGVDIVLDDGSHVASHQRVSFETLFPLLPADGLYLCEDLHTAYGVKFEGGLRKPGTFIELTKSMIDWLHSRYILDAEAADPYDFKGKVFGIHIYDSLVVIEKKPMGVPFHTGVGHKKRKG
jgi:SAM-dependent methyltransferase